MPKRRARSKGLRLELSERGIWQVVGSIDGERIRKSLGTRDQERAVELKADYESRRWKSRTYGEQAVRTFEEAAESYMNAGGEARFLAPLIKHFKGRPLGSIKPAEVRAAATAIYPAGSSATRNRQGIAPCRAVIMHGHDLGWCGAIKVKQFEVAKSRKHKPVDRSWLVAFMAEADKSKLPHLSAIVLFMNQTAARVSEAVRLTMEHVDLEAKTATLEETKEGEWEVRHLTKELAARIKALNAKPKERVFGYTDPKAVTRRMKAVAKRAGLPERSSHSAGRHSFATNAMKLTKDVKGTMDAGGWKSAKLFMETYVHSNAAGETIAAKLDKASGPIDKDKAMPTLERRRNANKR
jgi:integrase